MKRVLLLTAVTLALAGCGENYWARADMEKARKASTASTEAYKACVRTGAPCTAEKAAMDADAQSFSLSSQALNAGMGGRLR